MNSIFSSADYYLSLDSLDMFVIYQLLVKSDMSVLETQGESSPSRRVDGKGHPSSYGGLMCTVRWFTKCKPERKSRSAWWCQAFSPAHWHTLLQNQSKNVAEPKKVERTTRQWFLLDFGPNFQLINEWKNLKLSRMEITVGASITAI